MSSEALPPKPAGTVRTRSMARAADPDAPPRVTEALAPPPAAAPPPSAAPTPSAATTRLKVRGHTHRMAQGADPDPAPPSAAPTPSAAPPILEPSKVRVRNPTRRAAQGLDTGARLDVAEDLAPLYSAARLPSLPAPPKPQKYRFVLRGDRERDSDPVVPVKAHESSTTSAVLPTDDHPKPQKYRFVLRSDRERDSDPVVPVKAHESSTTSAVLPTDMDHRGTNALSLAPSSSRTRSSVRLTAGNPAKSVGCNEVFQDTGKVLSSKPNGENKDSCLMLGEPNVGNKKNHELSSYMQLAVLNLSKVWSDKFDEVTDNFRTTMKGYSSGRPWQQQVDEATLNFVAELKEIAGSAAEAKNLALIYDERMLLHKPRSARFNERPQRLTSIMKYLHKNNLIDRCDLFECDKATDEQLLAVHTSRHVEDIKSISSKDQDARDRMAFKHSPKGDIYYSEGSGEAALLAAGGAIKACSLVAEKRYQYSFAIIRPPGHHAGPNGPAGFCLLNNAAIAAADLLKHHHKERVLIVDWDVHHSNGTQDTFYGDERVLVFSIHRYERNFYPNTGSAKDTGEGRGAGFNVNVALPNGEVRDVDYSAVWEHVLLPLTEEFKPEIILISSGFDAAQGDTLGDCCVTPGGFASLLHMLMRFAPVVMILEGGYNLQVIAKCTEACIKVLLGDNSAITHDEESLPYDTTLKTILETRKWLRPFWGIFASEIPKAVFSRSIPYIKKVVPAKPEGSRCQRPGRNKKLG